ncbi:hypothetical protein AMECASPLE_018012 [Ameca splendens]|uniref:Uncharacterized protein n=1 Tax=Ameca splendens TaxID=208324 RepID=A0ABV0ZNR9_9TELE
MCPEGLKTQPLMFRTDPEVNFTDGPNHLYHRENLVSVLIRWWFCSASYRVRFLFVSEILRQLDNKLFVLDASSPPQRSRSFHRTEQNFISSDLGEGSSCRARTAQMLKYKLD